MNVVFTIVTKSYLGLANTVLSSIRKFDKGCRLVCIVADHWDGSIDAADFDFDIVIASDLRIPDFESLTFKYNVTEFCTAIKPYGFRYSFDHIGAEKVIYVDPDLFFYDTIDPFWAHLDTSTALVTPHFVTFENTYTGYVPEHAILYSGLYNFGFFALKKNSASSDFIDWWARRLHDLCYADVSDGLYVDQKWADYVNVFFSDSLQIIKSLGCNIAYWNIHEREFYLDGDVLMVKNRITGLDAHKVIFCHFSGVDPRNIYHNRQCPSLDFDIYQDYLLVIKEYASASIVDFNKYIGLDYSFANFPNNGPILHFHRRLYRSLIADKPEIEKNFDPHKIFMMFKESSLITSNDTSPDKLNENNIAGIGSKKRLLSTLFKFMKGALGVSKYLILIRYLNKYSRPERQGFLLRNKD